MKTNAERAREQLTLMPKTEFTLERDGFIGALYQLERNEYHGKAIIMFSGSDGIYSLMMLVIARCMQTVGDTVSILT